MVDFYTYDESLSSTYWIPTLPSIDPTAKPLLSVKHDTTRVCHFKGDVKFYNFGYRKLENL